MSAKRKKTTAGGKKEPLSYRRRTYRDLLAGDGLIETRFRLKETDLHILTSHEAAAAAGECATACRLQIERYASVNPAFLEALGPLEDDPLAPRIVRDMLAAGRNAGVGPMAAVAGAISEYVGRALIEAGNKEVIVENGGDIFIRRVETVTVGIFAGRSVLSGKVGLRLEADRMPLGICTSSGTVGHSLSFGMADAVTVLADSAITADAAATRIGNEARDERSRRKAVDRALEAARDIPALRGVLVICGDAMGALGDIELIPMHG